MSAITLEIDELVIDGIVGVRDGERLARSTEAALQQLVARRGLTPSDSTAVSQIATGRVALSPDAGHDTVADALAGAIHHALGGGK
jgi:hypothetical protein